MARPDKVAAVEEMAAQFAESDAAVLTEYRGLTVAQMKDLRRALGEDATYAVAKNTLTRRAVAQAGIEGLEDALVGPTAIAFIRGDIAAVAKGLKNFAKDHPLLVIKGGVMEGRVLDADEVKKLADLESREVLLAKLAGAMKGTMQQAASLFAAPMATAARAFGALQSAAEENPSLIGGAGEAAAAEQTSEPEQEAPASDEAAEPAAPADAEAPVAEDAATDAAPAAESTDDAADAASNE